VTEKLLIRIDQSAKQAIHWLIYSAEQQIIASGEYKKLSDLAQLTEKAQGRETTVLLSAAVVQLKTIELPTKWNRKLEQALPFMLEEQLACDVDDVFIAIGEPGSKDDKPTINIALCDRDVLAELVALFDEHQIPVKHILPDALLLPEQADDELAVIELDGQWLCRLGQWHGCVIEPSWGADYLHALAPKLITHFSPADALPEVAPKIAKEAEYELPLALLAKNLGNTPFNLRQGLFAPKKSTPQWWKDWRSGLIAASVALVGFVTVQGLQIVQLQNQADQFKAEAIDTYKKAFPNRKVREALLRKQITHFSPADALPEVAPKIAKEAEYELPLALLAKNLGNTPFNLRQGLFAPKKSTPQWWKDWRSGLIAASVALVGFVTVQGLQIVQLQNQAEQFKAEAIDTYKKAFPNRKVREALLRKQIESELRAISATKQGGFLDLTDKFVSVYSQVKDFQPETLRYDHKRNELRIRVKAKDFQVFGQVKTILEQKGLTVQQGSLNNDGDAVIGEIRLRGEA
jgi:general secretion pathway protein L